MTIFLLEFASQTDDLLEFDETREIALVESLPVGEGEELSFPNRRDDRLDRRGNDVGGSAPIRPTDHQCRSLFFRHVTEEANDHLA